MTQKNTVYAVVGLILLAFAGYVYLLGTRAGVSTPQVVDSTPQNVTLSGTYTCLPHKDTTGPQTEECAFGFKADTGEYYAVNFGASAKAMEQFRSGAHITADGFVVSKEVLGTTEWDQYSMKGMFTITTVHSEAPAQGKLNINAVCDGALAYMTFPDGASAEQFVTECKEGKHPEVIEQYKAQMGLGDGATI